VKRHADTEGRAESAGPLFDAAVQRRDIGMQRASAAAERHASGWEDEAVEAVRVYASTHAHFATEDVRLVHGTPEGVDGRAWGAVMRHAERLRIVRPDGFALVNSSNRSPKVRWRSLVFESKR
jgi:hypothetical protein